MKVQGRTWALLVVMGLVMALTGLMAVTARTWAQGDEEHITLKLRDTPIDDALRMLFQDTPYSYTLAPGITGTVTVTLNDVTFSQALRAILDIHNLTYRKEEGNVYVITRRGETGGTAPGTTVETPAAQTKVYWLGPGGRYELQFLDSRMVALWFGGRNAGGDPIPRPLAGVGGAGGRTTGGVGIGGGVGGIGGGVGGLGGGGYSGGGYTGGGGTSGGGGGRTGGGGTSGRHG